VPIPDNQPHHQLLAHRFDDEIVGHLRKGFGQKHTK
jgi:hypothetical protein